MPCVAHLPSYGSPASVTAPLPITVVPMMSVGFSRSATARASAARIAAASLPGIVSVRQPHASYLRAVSSLVTSLHECDSWIPFES